VIIIEFSQCTGWSKSHATHSWYMFYLSKNKLQWNQKTKKHVIVSVGNVHRVQRCMHSLFSSCLMQPGEEFLCHGNGSPDNEILLNCLAQENREMYPWTHSGKLRRRMRCQVVFDNEHLWKRHPCTLTVERQLTDWHEQVTWHDMTYVGSCIVTEILCVY
jgi:hypothetical protein